MRLSSWLVAVVVVGLTAVPGTGQEALDYGSRHLISIKAEYTPPEDLVIVTVFHDFGVLGPGDVVTWELECDQCPDETMWQITDLLYAVNLHEFETVVSERLAQEDPPSTIEITPADLGLIDKEIGRRVANETFVLAESVTKPTKHGDLISIKRRTADPARVRQHERLWKFTVRVWIPDSGGAEPPESCDLPACVEWDPHFYDFNP